MNTLSYGYKKPQNPDKGDTVFPALETNIQQLNDHDHDGSDSAPLYTHQVTAAAGAWVSSGSGGMYRQVITMPGSLVYDTTDIWARRSTGERAYPAMERIDSASFYLYTNDNSLAYTLSFR